MKITIEIPDSVADAIIDRSAAYAKELGREIAVVPVNRAKLVGAVLTELLSEDNDPYEQRITDFDNWVDADNDTDGEFEKIVKKHSLKL